MTSRGLPNALSSEGTDFFYPQNSTKSSKKILEVFTLEINYQRK